MALIRLNRLMTLRCPKGMVMVPLVRMDVMVLFRLLTILRPLKAMMVPPFPVLERMSLLLSGPT